MGILLFLKGKISSSCPPEGRHQLRIKASFQSATQQFSDHRGVGLKPQKPTRFFLSCKLVKGVSSVRLLQVSPLFSYHRRGSRPRAAPLPPLHSQALSEGPVGHHLPHRVTSLHPVPLPKLNLLKFKPERCSN